MVNVDLEFLISMLWGGEPGGRRLVLGVQLSIITSCFPSTMGRLVFQHIRSLAMVSGTSLGLCGHEWRSNVEQEITTIPQPRIGISFRAFIILWIVDAQLLISLSSCTRQSDQRIVDLPFGSFNAEAGLDPRILGQLAAWLAIWESEHETLTCLPRSPTYFDDPSVLPPRLK